MSTRYALAALALALAFQAAPARAQAEAAAVDAVKRHFAHDAARYGAAPADLDDLAVTDAYAGRRSGATYVYLKQAHRGIEVYNAPAQAAVTADGAVVAPHARFVRGLAARVNADAPALGPDAAAAAAAAHLRRATPRPAAAPVLSDVAGEPAPDAAALYPLSHFVPDVAGARLVYFATGAEGAGSVRLSWDVLVDTRDGGHLFSVRVDAVTGAVLDVADLTAHDTWAAPRTARDRAARDLAPYAPALLTASPSSSSGSYNVFALPLESPDHGVQTLAVSPHDPAASPEGWHDTGSAAFTITRGNNVYAYEDRNGDNAPGVSPDGGAGLVFDFPFNPAQAPTDYQALAVTNLFYWNNVVHDVLWRYGFDEPAGNFQANNFGLGGNGFDDVRAEAQDNAAGNPPSANNANFSTPPDGGPGRMQMFEWSGVPLFEVNAPASIAGVYASGGAAFGVNATVTGEVVQALTKDGELAHACGSEPIGNPADLAGNIAIIERGTPLDDPSAADCFFQSKARQAQQAGAIGVVIYNCSPNPPQCNATNPEEIITMAGATGQANDITIPAVFVAQSTGIAMRENAPGVTATITARAARDSDLDAGIIAHEYGHGLSNRLTGGPNNTACLQNAEQMGEGWSDYVGLMLTQRPGDTAALPRGIGTYVTYQGTDGPGIRQKPYSTDFAVNDWTYGDTAPMTVVHDIGEVWATMLWEMTWELIGARGYDPDVYDAAGDAGNQVALQLVVEGMKLQPCSPGFVDGRDAILAADALLYGGANYDQIWTAFARRGLGLNASQGSSATVADNVEDFTVPANVAAEPGAEGPAAYRLSGVSPNPGVAGGRQSFTLSVPSSQAVSVGVYDALGRRVALLHDGPLSGGVSHRFSVGSGLAAGSYVVRAVGEGFAVAERFTVLR